MPNGYWSKVSYWTVVVPEWVKPTPIPTRIPTSTPYTNVETTLPIEDESDDDDDGDWGYLVTLGLIGGSYWLGSRGKKEEPKV